MPSLTIITVGAGIAGLTAAIALRQQGHDVVLLEKSTFNQEIGAAIHVSPNCTRLLQRLGLDTAMHGGNRFVGMSLYDGAGTLKVRMDLSGLLQEYNSPFDLIHRADLHNALKQLAADETAPGPVPRLLLGCRIAHIDPSQASVSLDDGSTFKGDLIVGADGAHSVCRSRIDPSVHAVPSGKSCYRFLVQRADLLADEQTAPLVDAPGWMKEFSDGARRLVLYPCRKNTTMNVAAFVPDSEILPTYEGGEAGSRDQLLQSFSRFSSSIRRILSYADPDVKVWQLSDMPSLPTWSSQSLVLIGDAAHPFLPYLGEGGAMAIEDANCIARLLPPSVTKNAIAERLRLYEKIRYERVEFVREMTRTNVRDKGERLEDPLSVMRLCYQHDEWMNTEERLKGTESTHTHI